MVTDLHDYLLNLFWNLKTFATAIHLALLFEEGWVAHAVYPRLHAGPWRSARERKMSVAEFVNLWSCWNVEGIHVLWRRH